jgi:hypothetical protein
LLQPNNPPKSGLRPQGSQLGSGSQQAGSGSQQALHALPLNNPRKSGLRPQGSQLGSGWQQTGSGAQQGPASQHAAAPPQGSQPLLQENSPRSPENRSHDLQHGSLQVGAQDAAGAQLLQPPPSSRPAPNPWLASAALTRSANTNNLPFIA